MPHLSPTTLTQDEQKAILRATAKHVRDHLIFSLALGTGLRLAEIVGLNVGDAFLPDGTPRGRIRLRREIAKGGRVGDVFLPDALGPKLRRFWNWQSDSSGSGTGSRIHRASPSGLLAVPRRRSTSYCLAHERGGARQMPSSRTKAQTPGREFLPQ